jgi:SAM-dependent methyltransferase
MRRFFTRLFSNFFESVRMEQEPVVDSGNTKVLEEQDLGSGTSDGSDTSLTRTDYYTFNADLDRARPDNVSHRATNLYIEDLNLEEELHGLGEGAVIVDVGSSYARGTEGLKERPEFSSLSFVGVTPVVFERRGTQGYTIPILEGTAESLPKVLDANNIGKADVLLLRNVMEEIYLGEKEFDAEGLLEDSLRGLYDALKPGGKVLIYDQYGTGERDIKFYQEYMEKAQELGFSVEEIPCPPRTQFKDRMCPNYLRFTK